MNVFWFEFLLNKDLLSSHLLQDGPGNPNAIALLTQFVQNAEKWKDDCGEDSLEKVSRAKKSRVLTKLALRTAAFLYWDLDTISTLPMSVQHSLMLFTIEFCDDNVFLKSIYHRWVLRSTQTPLKRNNVQEDPAAEPILRSLNAEESVTKLNKLVTEIDDSIPFLIPTLDSFDKERVDPSTCISVSAQEFRSMVHLDIGIYYFYKGQLQNASIHFQQQKIPTAGFPYLKMSQERLNGYLKGLGLVPLDRTPEPIEALEPETVKIGKLVRKGNFDKLKHITSSEFAVDESSSVPLNPDFEEPEESESANYFMEKCLLEASDMAEIKELLIKLHAGSGGSRSFAKLFASWEIAIPIQNGILNILPGAFQDYIHILVAKSKQLLNIKLFTDSRTCLQLAQSELTIHLQSIAPSLVPYIFSITKLGKMLDWEILLVDIHQLLEEWPQQAVNLSSRCTECLHCFKHQASDVNPRAEIIENILMAFLNIGEFEYVASLEQFQQKWPFLEFLSLIAKVCTDLMEAKDSSTSYRELWHAVLPHFSNSSSVRRQPVKTGILSSRSMLQWVIDRSKSQLLLQIFVSLFARLHNHYTDDMGLQIQTDYLHIWPNVLDEVTTSLDSKSRVSGASKLNAKQIRDVLFQLLRTPASSEAVWLKCIGDVYLASGNPSLAMKSYLEYLALSSDFFEKHSVTQWTDNALFRRMIKCSEIMQAFTQALILCQFLSEVDYSTAFGMAQEKVTSDAGDSLYGFVWDLTILEFLINLHTKRNEMNKRQQAMKIMGLMELNSNNNEEIQREAMHLRKSQFMRTLAKVYIFS